MTKRERDIKDRFWLKIHRFVTTHSLKAKLAKRTDLTDRQREFCCYIQSKVLRETRKQPSQFANIGAKYWEDKCGSDYRRWVDLLKGLRELHENAIYRKGTSDKKGFTKSYRIPPSALKSGVTIMNFKTRATPIEDHTDLRQADDIIRYVRHCSSLLTVPKTLVEIAHPIRDATAHEFSRRVYWGDFNIRYGDHSGRLFHSIIEMPREARGNLVFKGGGSPLFEYDIKSCHPVLLLPLFTDPLERAKFSLVLDNDVYSTIRDIMDVPEDRDWLKIQFMVCTNSIDRYVAGKRGIVYRFFRKYFPVFAREVLDCRSDLAVLLQRQESRIMVQELGRFCIERNIFWIPCHDGWMGIEEGEEQILKKVGEGFLLTTGYPVRITKMGVGGNSNSFITHIPSYVRIEPTSTTSDYKKVAEDWFAALPKRPQPDPEVLNKRREARQRQREAYQDECQRIRESEQLRRDARPLWNNLMRDGEHRKAA